ncbi:MAG: hypothetical protein LBN00_11130 [Oscillospiraceae bacterium]|jgi:hypothetical protein|nr:hypothetical protein [Oscillospiraceae bacterium]
MNKVLSDYIDSVSIEDKRLSNELATQVDKLYYEELANGADEDFAAKQITTIFEDPKKLGRVIRREQRRASGVTELIATAVISAGLLILSIVSDAIGEFTPVRLFIIFGMTLVISGVFAAANGFKMSKFLRGAQVAGLLVGICLFVFPIFRVQAETAPEFGKISYSAALISVTLLYSAIICTSAAIVRCGLAGRNKARIAVARVLHNKLRYRMI